MKSWVLLMSYFCVCFTDRPDVGLALTYFWLIDKLSVNQYFFTYVKCIKLC